MNECILSVCIPTYNRCDLLEESLDNLISQIEKLNYRIEICVSDNCSTDRTADMLKSYQERYSSFKVNINKFNCGYDYNLCRVINMAEGRYVWTLSDDDIVLNQSMEYIINLISKYEKINSALIFIKPQFEKKENLDSVKNHLESQARVFTETVVENAEDILIEFNWLISFLSAFILRREYINTDIAKFLGSGFIHTPMILDCIKYGNAIITNNNHILCRQNNSGGYNIYKYFGTNIAGIFNYYKINNIYSNKVIDFVITEWLRYCVLGNVICCKLKGNTSFEKNNKVMDLLIPYRTNKFFVLKVLPILIMPNWCLKAIAKWRKWEI